MTTLAFAAWLLSFALAPTGAVTVKLPEMKHLVAAVRSRDEVEIERVAARLGPAKLLKVAERGKRDEQLAALKALAVVESGWAELPELARLAGEGDPELAAAAVQCALRISERMSPETVDADEVPRDVPRRAAQAFLQVAARVELAAPVRTGALATAAQLRAVAPVDDTAIAKLLANDPEPAVRRTAAEALYFTQAPLPAPPTAKPARPTDAKPAHPSESPIDQALEGALKDAPPEVASAAAATLCRDVPLAEATSSTPAEARAAKLGPPARARVRSLAADENVALADRLDLIACLRVFGEPDDKKMLDELARKPPDALKRRARALGGR